MGSVIMHNYYHDYELEKFGFRKIGSDVLISRDARIYGAEYLELKSHIRIDDFSVISIQSESLIGNNVHVSTGTKIITSLGFELHDFSGTSLNSILLGDSDDFSGKYLTNPTCSKDLRNVKSERVILKKHAVVLAGGIMLPGAKLSEGVILGANSLLKQKTESWTIYAGIPAQAIKKRTVITY